MTEVPLEINAAVLTADELSAGIEAILLIADTPLNPLELATSLQVSQVAVHEALADIQARLGQHFGGIELREVAGGYRLYTAEAAASLVESYVRDGQAARLTQAALETLAVVAYKQPITRARISAIRGVNVDSVMKTLETRGLVEVAETEPETGALLFRTTDLFLEKLGLNSLSDLEPIAQYLPDIATASEIIDAL